MHCKFLSVLAQLLRHLANTLAHQFPNAFSFCHHLYQFYYCIIVPEICPKANLLFRQNPPFEAFHGEANHISRGYSIQPIFITEMLTIDYRANVAIATLRAQAPHILIFRTLCKLSFIFTIVHAGCLAAIYRAGKTRYMSLIILFVEHIFITFFYRFKHACLKILNWMRSCLNHK